MRKNILLIISAIIVIVVAVVGYSFFKTPEDMSGNTVNGDVNAVAGETIFEISQDSSEARFIINETLRSEPTKVTGVTNQVSGKIAINPEAPQAAKVGVISINARTLATDSEFRNRAIKNRILLTDQHEFITFTPTELVGLPSSATIGQAYTFQIKGDLQITDVTKPVIFDVTLTPISNTEVKGSASTTILYKDFNLAIPDAPAVDEVEDTVILELEFIAMPQTPS